MLVCQFWRDTRLQTLDASVQRSHLPPWLVLYWWSTTLEGDKKWNLSLPSSPVCLSETESDTRRWETWWHIPICLLVILITSASPSGWSVQFRYDLTNAYCLLVLVAGAGTLETVFHKALTSFELALEPGKILNFLILLPLPSEEWCVPSCLLLCTAGDQTGCLFLCLFLYVRQKLY